MTERFTVKHIMFDGWCIYDIINDKYYDYGKNDLKLLCNELNKLIKENQELRKYLGWQDMELEEMEDLND